MEDGSETETASAFAGRKIWIDVPCRVCSYSLRGLMLADECPSCHTPVAQSLRGDPEQHLELPPLVAPRDAVDERQQVCTDLPCRGCGYNLRGLDAAGRCPECNAAVSLSCSANLLRYCEPSYVRRLARGAFWIRQAIVGGLIGVLVVPVLILCIATGVGTGALAALGVVYMSIMAASGLVALPALWLISVAEPAASNAHSEPGASKGERARRMVRVCLVATLLVAGLRFCVQRLGPVVSIRELAFVDLGFWVVVSVGLTAYLHYLARLAQRIPEPKYAARGRGLGRDMPVALGVLLGIKAVTLVFGPMVGLGALSSTTAAPGSLPHIASAIGSCVGFVATLAVLAMSISILRLQWRMSRALREQTERAERNWRSSGA